MDKELTEEQIDSLLQLAEKYKEKRNCSKKNNLSKKEKIGAILKQHRADSGLSQSDIASRLGYGSTNFISMIEKGKGKPPIERLYDFQVAYEGNTDLFEQMVFYFYPDVWEVFIKLQEIKNK